MLLAVQFFDFQVKLACAIFSPAPNGHFKVVSVFTVRSAIFPSVAFNGMPGRRVSCSVVLFIYFGAGREIVFNSGII